MQSHDADVDKATAAADLATRRLWAQALRREYARLHASFGLTCREPAIFWVGDLGRTHGRWDPLTRSLSIAEALVRKHPWDVVIEVLKHEMAHQMVDEGGGAEQRPHGEAFAAACARLGVEGWARRASGQLPRDLQAVLRPEASPAQLRWRRKVDKLLALASSSNEHEAAQACLRVRELTARYHLDNLESGQPGALVYAILGEGKRRLDPVMSRIVALLQTHFGVEAICRSLYDACTLCDLRVFEIVGTKHHVALAEHVYVFLRERLHSLWAQQRRLQGCDTGITARRSFQLGLVEGFEKTLRRAAPAEAAPQPGARALMRRDQLAVAAYLRARHPCMRAGAPGRRRILVDAYSAGMAQGADIVLHKPLSQAPSGAARLLTGAH